MDFRWLLFRSFGILKGESMAFLSEIHSQGHLSKQLGASFIALKEGVASFKDFHPISLTGSYTRSSLKF